MNKGPVPNTPYPMGGGQGYGEQSAMMDAQRAMPVASPTAPGPPPGPPDLGGALGGGGVPPGSWGDFSRPTERPNEPITHGLPSGPGGGPEVLMAPAQRPAVTVLQQMANSPFASEDIRTLLSIMQR